MAPLDDLLVFDLTRVLAGPFCTQLLGDLGARVVKLEHPDGGDDTRAFGPPFLGGESCYFLSVNRNKESVALDLKTPAGRDLARRLALRADVLVENFRPDVLPRLGLGQEELRRENPRLVYCSISGFGHSGDPAWVARGGYDLVVQGLSGVQALTGAVDGPPTKVGLPIADLVAGMHGALGVLAALHARTRTGRGQHVDVSMLDAQVSLLTYYAGIHLGTGAVPGRFGNAHPTIHPYQTYRAQDGHLNIACGNDAMFRAFAGAIGLPALAEDARFATNPLRVQHRGALDALLVPRLAEQPVATWLERLDAAGVASGPILGVGEVLAHPQLAARGMRVEVAHPTLGVHRTLGVPVRLSETPGAVRTAPPLLGQHTRSTLCELLGLEPGTLDGMLAGR